MKGTLLTCTSTSSTTATTSCVGLKVDGLDAGLASAEANAICNAMTGASYNNAGGNGSTTAPYMTYATGWVVATTGSTAPMQNLTCNR